MKKVIAVASGLLIFTATNLFAIESYRLTVKLQEFSRPDGKPADLKEVQSDPAKLGKLTAGAIRFLHRTSISPSGTIQEEVQIGKTEAKVSYTLREKKDGRISVTVSVELMETVAVKNGVPLKSTRSTTTTIDCPIGQEIPLGGISDAGSKEFSCFTIIVTK